MLQNNFVMEFEKKQLWMLTLYIFAMFIIFGLIIMFLVTLQIDKNQSLFGTKLDNALNNSLKEINKGYITEIKNLDKNTKITNMLNDESRELLPLTMKTRWESIKKRSDNNDIFFNIHLLDGTTPLRMTKTKIYLENEKTIEHRAMIREIHKRQKSLTGFEIDRYGVAYRVILPLFNKKKYVGAMELGVDLEYILQNVNSRIAQEGFIFIKKSDKTDKYCKTTNKFINGYELRSRLFGNSFEFLGAIDKNFNFKNHIKIEINDREYMVHIREISGVNSDEKALLVYFQDLEEDNRFFYNLIIGFLVFIIVSTIILIFIVKKRFSKILIDEISQTYSKHNDELSIRNKKIKHIKNVLQVVNDVNRLIVREKDIDKLIDKVCNTMVKNSVYSTAMIALMNKKGKFYKVSEVNINLDMSDLLKKNILPPCIKKIINSKDKIEIITSSEMDKICLNCSLKNAHKNISTFLFKISYQKKMYGILTVTLNKKDYVNYNKEYKLLREIADSIAFAIYNREIELENQRNTKRLKEAQHLAHIGSWEYDFKSDNFKWSEEVYRIFDIQKECFNNTYEGFLSFIHPEDIKKIEKVFSESVKNRTSFQVIHRIVKKDGEVSFVEQRCFHIRDDNGEVIKSIGTVQDISYRIRYEENLYTLNMLLEKASLSILISDVNGDIIYINPWHSKISGFSLEDVTRENSLIEKFAFSFKDDLDKAIKSISNKEAWSGESKGITKQGKEYWESTIIIPILDSYEKVVNYLIIKRDITKVVKLKSELKEREAMLLAQSRHAAMGEMISMIAHQWRQPLTVISMEVNNILADIELESATFADIEKNVKDIFTQTQHLSQTINDFRDFFKPTKSKEVTSVEKIMRNVLDIINIDLDKFNIKVNMHSSSKTETKLFSRDLIHIFLNIIKNAKEKLIEERVENPKIDIDIKEINSKVIVKICDNGSYIKSENKNRIYEPYFTTKGSKNGTGLGLYMAKNILQKHMDGDIGFFNKKESNGVCFVIEILMNGGG